MTGFFIFLKELRSKTSLIFLGAFCFLSFLVAAGLWQKTDVSVTVFLQSAATLGLDCFVTATGWLGSPEFTGLAALAGAVLIWRRYSTNLAAAFLSAMALATIIEMAAKLWVPQLPIPDEFQRGCGKLPGGYLYIAMPNSYPSGHIFRFAYLFFTAGRFLRNAGRPAGKLISWIIFLLICFFAVSRVYIGDHWLSDVLGGLVLAWLAAVWVMPAANDKIISS